MTDDERIDLEIRLLSNYMFAPRSKVSVPPAPSSCATKPTTLSGHSNPRTCPAQSTGVTWACVRSRKSSTTNGAGTA